MIFYRYYSDIPQAEVDRFVQTQELGRLITVGADGTPHVGLYPFLYDAGGTIELHVARADEQVADLRRGAGIGGTEGRPGSPGAPPSAGGLEGSSEAPHVRCVLEVDEVLGTIPSYWVHPEYGGVATAYHRTVIFECAATVVEDPGVIAEQQRRLLGRYQPESGFRPVDAADPLYRSALERLVAVRLRVERCRPLFKLAQNRPPDVRREIVGKLRERGRRNDERAAAALEWTLDREDAGVGARSGA